MLRKKLLCCSRCDVGLPPVGVDRTLARIQSRVKKCCQFFLRSVVRFFLTSLSDLCRVALSDFLRGMT